MSGINIADQCWQVATGSDGSINRKYRDETDITGIIIISCIGVVNIGIFFIFLFFDKLA